MDRTHSKKNDTITINNFPLVELGDFFMSNFKKIHLHGTRIKQKGKKGYRKRKYLGGMGNSKHRTSGVGTNHKNCIDRVREFNLEEERYKKLREKRKGPMYDNVIQLFRMLKHY